MSSSDSQNTSVLITGAGPVGLMMACQLSRHKVSCRIIDRKKEPSRHSGAMVVHALTLELFQQMGLADKLAEQGIRAKRVNLFFNGHKTHVLDIQDAGQGISPFHSMLLVEQWKTEQLLISYLNDININVEWETELVNLHQDEEHVQAVVSLPDNRQEQISAQYLIGADGAKSTVRSILKIPFKGKTHKMPLSIIECFSDVELEHDEVGFAFSPEATAGFFPIGNNSWRIDAALKRASRNEKLTFDRMQEHFNADSCLEANIRQAEWFSVFHSHSRIARQYSHGRCFLVGDAAHLCTPVGGQGMNTGLQDACNLAWKLALVLNGLARPAILDTYEKERKPIAVKVTRSSDRFFKLVASRSPMYRLFRKYGLKPLTGLLFRLMHLKSFSRFVFRSLSGTGIRYQPNLLMAPDRNDFPDNSPGPGTRLPYVRMEGHISTHDLVDGTSFVLLIFAKKGAPASLLRSASRWKDHLQVQFIPYVTKNKEIYHRMGIRKKGWYLVRPDLCIACRSATTSQKPLEKYFNMLWNSGK